MDCLEETANLHRETTKSSQQYYFDDVFTLNSVTEEFSVDDLLDLSSEQFESFDEEEKDSVSFSSRFDEDSLNSRHETGTRPLDSFPSVPVDDWEDLEWLSKFVDDSGSEFSLPFPVEKTASRDRSKPVLVSLNRKARSKRRRRILNYTSFLPFIFEKPVMKKSARKVKPPVGPVQRRCSHCQVQKTPQWRTGPLGAKTLCNACGVRFKSGRLFPEYRPACSPTFSVEVHSNSHRKVLELRSKKDIVGEPEIRSELLGVVEPV